MHAQKILRLKKVIWTILLLALILLPFIYQPYKAPILLNEVCEGEYDDYFNTTTCDVTLTFDQDVDSGDVVISWYNENGDLIETTTEYFISGYEGKLNSSYIRINGNVDTFEIVDYSDISSPNNLYFKTNVWVFAFFFFLFWLVAITRYCNVYYYKNNTILVYAGAYNYYMELNGERVDEEKVLFRYTPLYLETELSNGDFLQCKISTLNHIVLKINNRLCKLKKRKNR